jgi:hypothetical protein
MFTFGMIALCQVVTRSLGAVYSNQRQTAQLLLHNTTTTTTTSDFQTGLAYITKLRSCISHTRLQRPTQDITHVHERGSTAKTAVSLAQPRATHSLRNDDLPRPSAPLVRVRAPIRSSNPLLSEPQPCSRAFAHHPNTFLLPRCRRAGLFVVAQGPSYLAQRCYRQPCVLRQTAHCCGASIQGKRYWPLRVRR